MKEALCDFQGWVIWLLLGYLFLETLVQGTQPSCSGEDQLAYTETTWKGMQRSRVRPPANSRIPMKAFSSVQFSRSVVSDSLRPQESQHARPPCPTQTPRVHSDSCPSSQWCHLTISSSVVRFSSCPQSLPASGSFPMKNVFRYCQMYPEGRAEITLVENHWFTVFLTQSLSFFLF